MTATWTTVASWTGSSTSEPNTVAVISIGPRCQVRSADSVPARSAVSPVSGASRDRPASSVSSVNGVGAKAPRPTDTRVVHAGAGLTSSDTRGLTSVPYSLCASTRALADSDARGPRTIWSWAKTAGAVNV